MTEVLDRIEEELVAAARRRASTPAPAHRRLRAPRRTLALAGAGVLLAGGGAVAAVTTGSDPVPSDVQRSLENTDGLAPALPGGLRVTLTVGEGRASRTVVAYEADRGEGVRGSEALCVAGYSRFRPPDETGIRWLIVPCQGPWPLSEGAGLQSIPVGREGSPGQVTAGLVEPDVSRVELVLPDGAREPVKLSPPLHRRARRQLARSGAGRAPRRPGPRRHGDRAPPCRGHRRATPDRPPHLRGRPH